MRITYLILAHDQPKQFRKLVEALSTDGRGRFIVYIDGKVAPEQFWLQGSQEHLTFISNPKSVSWGGWSQVEAMLNLLEVGASVSESDFYVFLSGRDYPIRSNQEIHSFFENRLNESFINFYPLVDGAEMIENIQCFAFYDLLSRCKLKVTRELVKLGTHLLNKTFAPRKFIRGYTPYRGSTSWCLSREATDYIVDFVNDTSNRRFIQYFKKTPVPTKPFSKQFF